MSAASEAVSELVAQVRRRTGAGNPTDVRSALASVLYEMDVVPGDPAWADGRDVVGEAFERLLSTARRRPLGQFFTPLWAARPMAEWVLAKPTELLLDPGCGSGSLIVAAAQARRGHKTRLLGVDIDPLALKMARATGHVRDIAGLELREADFLLDALPERPGAVICNPPYTRHQDVPPTRKAAIHDLLAERFGRRFSRLASLHVLFLLRALEVSSDDARIAFLTPAHWLDMNYAREIKAVILEQAHVDTIVSFPVEYRMFDHAITTAGITLIQKGVSAGRSTRIARLPSSDLGEAELRSVISGTGSLRSVKLGGQPRWSHAQHHQAAGGVPIGMLARVKRGIATGCNAFFVLNEDRRLELALEADVLAPCIASPRHFAGHELRQRDLKAMDSTVPRWLLHLHKAPRSGAAASYLHQGRNEFAVRDRTLVQQRVKAGRRWFEIGPDVDADAPILFTYLNRSRARFVRNLAGAAPLNNWLLLQPHPGVDTDLLFALLQQLPASESLRSNSRHYGKGLWKLEPRELERLLLPPEAASLLTA